MTTAAEYAALAETSANTAATAAVDVQNKVAIAESSANLSTTNSNTVAASIAGAASANTTAALQAVAAQNYRDLAQLWANADPNVIVEGTAFSARHQALSTIATLAAMQVNLDTHTDLYTANKVTTDAALAYLAYRLDTGDLVFDSSTIDTTISNLNNTLSTAINNRLTLALYNTDTLNLANFAASNDVSTSNKIMDYLDEAGQIALQAMITGASNQTKVSYAGVYVDSDTGSIVNAAGSAVATEYGIRVAAVEETIGTEYIAGTGSISAKYTVKVDAGGRVAGFGLLSTANTDLSGTGFSEFVVAADSFKVGGVGSNIAPFRVITGAGVCVSNLGVETGNVAQASCTGTSTWIPPGTYMNTAMIGNATIDVAKISNLTVTTGNQIAIADAANRAYAAGLVSVLSAGAVATAQATADGKIDSFFQNSAPTTGMSVGDLWFDTNDGNKPYRHNGTSWIVAQDDGLKGLAEDAQATADGKIVTFFQNSTPTATSVGDLWVDTNDSNRMYRWNGSSWADAQDTTVADNIYTNNTTTIDGGNITTGTITADMVTTGTGNNRIEITNTAIKVYNGGSLRVKIGDLS